MNATVHGIAVQDLVHQLVSDQQMAPSPMLEVQRLYRLRSSGKPSGWTLVLDDLVSDQEYHIGSDWPWEVLERRRPWRYRETPDGLAILPGPVTQPPRLPAAAVEEAWAGVPAARRRRTRAHWHGRPALGSALP